MSEFPKKAADGTNTFAIVVIGVVAVLLTWASVVGLQAYFQNSAGEVRHARATEGASAEVRALDAAQRATLQALTYADPGKGAMKHLPIDRAKELVVRSQRNGDPSLVPAIGPHDVPTVPAVPGKAAPGAIVEAAGAAVDGEAAAVDGEGAAVDGEGAAVDGEGAAADGEGAAAEGDAAEAAEPAAAEPATDGAAPAAPPAGDSD